MIQYLQQTNLGSLSLNDLMLDADQGASNLRFIQRPSRVTVAIWANAVGVQMRIASGQRTVVQRSIVDGGGTTGQFPAIDQRAFTFFAAAGEILEIELRETTAVATTDVMAVISVDPIG